MIPIVEGLVSQFFFATEDILSDSLTDFVSAAKEWEESLHTVFAIALKLDGQLLLWGQMIKIIWPRKGEIADPVIMKVEETQASEGEQRVLGTLFPAILEEGVDRMTMSRDPMKSMDGLILRSLVLPQKIYGQPITGESDQLKDLRS